MTISEIAKIAGVSKATVSRILNNSKHVSDTTREKVLRIIQENNYEPSCLAQGLAKNENSTIGVIIPEIDNEFFAEILAGINEVIDSHNLTMICCDTNNNTNREAKALRTLAQQRVRGVIITPAEEGNEELRTTLQKLNVPVVGLDRHIQNSLWDGVYYDNFNSAYAATEVLINEGYTKIGVITGDLSLKIGRDRFAGYKEALHNAGVLVDDRYIYYGDFKVETAYQLSSQMFKSGDYPEAILTSNNRTTMGFLKAAREAGIRIGYDIALIGIDHVTLLNDLGIPFSCVARDSKAMGREAINILLDRIKSNTVTGRKITIVPYEIRLHGSEKRSTECLIE